jgi:hypothetical protein
MVIPETSYDFGDVFAGQYMYHVFPIRNDGTSPLTLSDELPGKPAVKPSPPVSPAAGAYTYPRQNANPSLDAMTIGEAFGVGRYPNCRPGAAFVARGARTTGERSLAGATAAGFAANPFVSGEPEPT